MKAHLDVRFLSVLLAVAAFTLWSPPASAQSGACESGTVSYIFVDNHSIFDEDDLSEDQPFVWAYRLMNGLHVRTSEGFIRSELLFSEGDCFDGDLLEESERILRLYPFISTVDVYGVPQGDGSWHVVVDTKDEWTTKANIRVNLESGVQFRGADLTEENLLGRGILARAFIREEDERRDVGGEVFTPRIFGTRLDAEVSAGETRNGRFIEEELFYPFVGEIGRFALRQVFVRRDELFPYSLGVRSPGPEQPTHVLLPFEERRFELTFAARRGEPGNLATFGVGLAREELAFPTFPSDLTVAIDRDFGRREPADSAFRGPVSRHTLPNNTTRVNAIIGQRNIRFVQRRGLDALSGIQDIAVGTDVSLTLGRSIGPLSSTQAEPSDLYTRLRFYGGLASQEQVTFAVSAALEGRQVFSGGFSGNGWRDVLGEFDVLLYWKPPAFDRHTLLFRLEGAGGWRVDQPYQLTLGGPDGVRGYHRDDFPGGRRMIASLEDRVYLGWPWPKLIDLGLTAFTDVGRIWPGDAPFGDDSGWRGSVGGGLRLGFPAGTSGVIRVDLHVPCGPGTDLSDVFLRISAADLVGFAGGFSDRQLKRSRRNTVGSDQFISR